MDTTNRPDLDRPRLSDLFTFGPAPTLRRELISAAGTLAILAVLLLVVGTEPLALAMVVAGVLAVAARLAVGLVRYRAEDGATR